MLDEGQRGDGGGGGGVKRHLPLKIVLDALANFERVMGKDALIFAIACVDGQLEDVGAMVTEQRDDGSWMITVFA